MSQPQSITSLPELPAVERRRRAVQYSLAMAIRVVCILSFFFVQGWWLLIPVLGAVVLPYIAVVVANVAVKDKVDGVERPGAIVPMRVEGP